MSNPWLSSRGRRPSSYDSRFEQLARDGHNVHGEADFIHGRVAGAVLDAGCGTGRIAIELARRGHDVVGVDLDEAMLAVARDKAPALTWIEHDLAHLDLGRTFDGVVMAGNVMIFLTPGTESAVLASVARHLLGGGLCIAGFSLSPDKLDLDAYDGFATQQGLVLIERCATWEGDPFTSSSDYAVSVHQKS